MATRSPGKSRRRLTRLLLILFGFLIGAVIAEGGLRAIGYSYPAFYTVDQSRGFALLPGMSGWYRKEGEAYVRINSDGMRDVEHSQYKPGDVIRIAVLGDSQAEALQVPLEQTFWRVMQERLQTCDLFAGKSIEVLNFGVSGYGTAQELITLREQVWKFSPDVVLLTVTTNNDISDNLRELKKTDEIPYFVFRDGKLVLDDSFKTSRSFLLRQSNLSRLGRWIKDRSRLVQAANQAHHGFKILLATWKPRFNESRSATETGTSKTDIVTRSEELGVDNVVYLEPRDQMWSEAWRVTEGLIVQMRDEVRDKGAEFLVVTLSNGPQVLPDPKSREAFRRRLGITDLFYPDNRIRALAERERIPIITLAPDLQARAERDQVFLHGFGQDIGNGHWNASGHARAGELIAHRLCENILGK